MAFDAEALAQARKRVEAGGAERYHAANAAKGKLFARERIALLVDEGSFVEDGLYANSLADGLPADGVITGNARIDGRMAELRDELEAREAGLHEMQKDMRILKEASGGGGRAPSFLQTHPDPDARIAKIEASIETFSRRTMPGFASPGPP